MFSGGGKQLKTQRTQGGKNSQNQQRHCDKIDLLRLDESLTDSHNNEIATQEPLHPDDS